MLSLVPDLAFSQPARRNLLAPILLAVAVLAAVFYVVLHTIPHGAAQAKVTRVETYGSHLVFKAESTVVGRDSAEDVFYAVATVHITNGMHVPLFLKDFTATLTPGSADPAGSQPLTTSAVEHPDLSNLFTSFPAVKALASQTGVPPLLRESQVDPGRSVDGYIILHFPITEDTWKHRAGATLTIDTYHQPSIKVPVPPTGAGVPAAAKP